MDVFTRWGEPFHNVYVYQIIMLHTLNILQFFDQLHLNKNET